MCSDRNLCSKNLIEARDEITEMKRKLKIMSHQIDQLKEEIASKVKRIFKTPPPPALYNMGEVIWIDLLLMAMYLLGVCAGEEQHGPDAH